MRKSPTLLLLALVLATTWCARQTTCASYNIQDTPLIQEPFNATGHNPNGYTSSSTR
jgi:hypothetical protein